MSVKSSGQFSFVDALAPQLVSGSGRLDRLHGLVKWYRFEKVLGSLRGSGPGRPAYSPLLMFQVLLLQSLYGLSDAETEAALADRLSFRRFVGLALSDAVPDHSTICRFRNYLGKILFFCTQETEVLQVYFTLFYLAVRSFDKAHIIYLRMHAKCRYKTDVWSFRCFNGTQAAVVAVVYVTHLKARALPAQTARA